MFARASKNIARAAAKAQRRGFSSEASQADHLGKLRCGVIVCTTVGESE